MDPLSELTKVVEDARQAALVLAQELAPLADSPAFKKFLETIQGDLAATRARRQATPLELNYSPAHLVCQSLEDYQAELLNRVEDKIREAKQLVIEEEKQEEESAI